MITGQGLLVMLAGYLEETLNSPHKAWSIVFGILAGVYISFFVYHKFALPKPEINNQQKRKSFKEVFSEFAETFKLFFLQKKYYCSHLIFNDLPIGRIATC